MYQESLLVKLLKLPVIVIINIYYRARASKTLPRKLNYQALTNVEYMFMYKAIITTSALAIAGCVARW